MATTFRFRALPASLLMAASLAHAAPQTAAKLPEAPLEVSQSWLRLPPPGVKTTAGYMTLRNTGKTPLTVTGITTASPTHVELHTSSLGKNGTMSMQPTAGVAIAPGATVALAPSGTHAMVFDAPQLKAGEALEFTLQLQDGRKVEGTFIARKP